jgi:hypothetical protein
MEQTKMPFWDQTGDADGSERGNYFTGDGEYDVIIHAVKHKNGYKGESVIVNVEVIASNNPDVPIGTPKSCAFNLTKQPILALGNIKAVVCGIYGWDASKKDAETKAKVNMVSKRMVEADNPLQGIKVHLTTFMTKTSKGGDFTNLKWDPYRAEANYAPPMPSATAQGFTAPAPPAPGAPPPPPPPATPNPARARAQATVGWVLADGRWYDGAEWRAP